jgi:hypothetical protein
MTPRIAQCVFSSAQNDVLLRMMTSLTCLQICKARFSSLVAFAPWSFQRGVSRTGSNCLKSPRKRIIGSLLELQSYLKVEHFSLIRTTILQPTILTSSMTRNLDRANRFLILSKRPRPVDCWGFSKELTPRAAWIVEPPI